MSRKLIIFGVGDIAELAHWYFQNDSHYEVAAFCVDAEFLAKEEFHGLPVVIFDDILVERYPPADYDLFIAVSYNGLNQLRKDKFLRGKELGYTLASYISTNASMLNNGAVGENCFILEDNTVQPFVRIGDNVTMWSGNHIGHHSKIHNHVFIASHVVISGGVTIGERCFLGVNSTLRDHITVGECCVVGAGALLLGDAEAEGVYIGKATERARVPSSRLKRL